MTIFLAKSVKLTLEVFLLGYSYDVAYFHPDILIEAILIKKACILLRKMLKTATRFSYASLFQFKRMKTFEPYRKYFLRKLNFVGLTSLNGRPPQNGR